MLKRMEFKTVALDTRKGHLNTDRIYQLGYLLYETDTNMGKFSDGEHHYKDLPYFSGVNNESNPSFKGLWNNETEYNEGDIVFDENNVYYIVIDKNKGEIPDESSKYLVLNDDIVGIKNDTSNKGIKSFTFADTNKNKSNIYTLTTELSPSIDTGTGIVSFPNGIEGYYNSQEIDEITNQIASEFDTLDNKIENMVLHHSSFRGEYDSGTTYGLGNYIHDGNDYYISMMNRNKNKKLSNKDYWKKITNDNLVLMKYQEDNIEAKICLTTIDINDCQCEECQDNPNCICHSGLDSIKLSKDLSPTVNLETGVLRVPGGIDGFVDETTYNNLLQRVESLEARLSALENQAPFEYDEETDDLNFN